MSASTIRNRLTGMPGAMLLLMLFATAGCETENNNNTTCDAPSCDAACAEQGLESGGCEADRCVCTPADGDLYSFEGGDTSDADTDTDTDTDTDADTDTAPDGGVPTTDGGVEDAGTQFS